MRQHHVPSFVTTVSRRNTWSQRPSGSSGPVARSATCLAVPSDASLLPLLSDRLLHFVEPARIKLAERLNFVKVFLLRRRAQGPVRYPHLSVPFAVPPLALVGSATWEPCSDEPRYGDVSIKDFRAVLTWTEVWRNQTNIDMAGTLRLPRAALCSVVYQSIRGSLTFGALLG